MNGIKKVIECLFVSIAAASAMEEEVAIGLDPNILILDGSKTISGYEYLEFDTSRAVKKICTDNSVISEGNILVLKRILINQTQLGLKNDVKEITLIIPGKIGIGKDEYQIYIAPEALSGLNSKCLRLNLIFWKGTIFPNDCSCMFAQSNSISEIDLSDIDSSVTNAIAMFKDCSNLKNIRFGKFKTNKITSMQEMFYGCCSLKELNLVNFDTNKVTSMSKMFYDCKQLTKLKFGDEFNTKEVINMNYMFYNCANLKWLNLENFDTSNVKYMQRMFSDCRTLEELDLESFNTSNVISMFGMFDFCKKLKNLNISSFSVEKIQDMRNMFANCKQLSKKSLPKYTKDRKKYPDLVKRYKMFTESCKIDPSDPYEKDDISGD